MADIDWQAAFETRDIETFLEMVFPPYWGGVAARILETGVEMTDEIVDWAPRWSAISPTVRGGDKDERVMWRKSVLYRAHDALHQIWGLPVPREFTSQERDYFIRVNMCGEVAVLSISEFLLAGYHYSIGSSLTRDVIWNRNAVPLISGGPLTGKSTLEIAGRLDGILHKKARPRWVRDDDAAARFCDDYVPMLEDDRTSIKRQWYLMIEQNWKPHDIPDVRPAMNLDGLELTRWMIEGFEHIIDTDTALDRALMQFNRERRRKIVLPKGW